jgi:hypothetical protein
MRPDYEFDKRVDLDPTEYTYKGKHEPFFGPGAGWVLFYFVMSFPCAWLAGWIIRTVRALSGVH